MQSLTEEVVRTTASILGPQSAAAKALQDADAKRAAGLEVHFFKDRSTILVASRAKQ